MVLPAPLSLSVTSRSRKEKVEDILQQLKGQLNTFTSPPTLSALSEKEVLAGLREARALLHDLCETLHTVKRGAQARQEAAQHLRDGLENVLDAYIRRNSAPYTRRGVRLLGRDLYRAAEQLFSLEEICLDVKKQATVNTIEEKRLILHSYSEFLSMAIKLGLPQIWVPIYTTLTHHNVLCSKMQPEGVLGQGNTVRPSPVHTSVNVKIAFVPKEEVGLFLRETSFMPIRTRLRHLALLEKVLPSVLKEVGDVSHQDNDEGSSIRMDILYALTMASSPLTYAAWLNTWNEKGFLLKPDTLWWYSATPHKVPSAYACAHKALAYDSETRRVSVIIKSDSAGKTLKELLHISPDASPDKQYLIVLADYVLPLLHEGERFLEETGLSWKTITALPPRRTTPNAETKKEETCPLDVLWSPWQHLAAYLLLLNPAYDPRLFVSLQDRLDLFERHWGPPCTTEGGIDVFLTWYDRLSTLTSPTIQDTPGSPWEKVRLAWQHYLESHRVSSTLEQVLTVPSEPEEGKSAPAPLQNASPRRRRV